MGSFNSHSISPILSVTKLSVSSLFRGHALSARRQANCQTRRGADAHSLDVDFQAVTDDRAGYR